MTDNLITMQHASKTSAGFSHEGFSVASDSDGIISIPAHFAEHAKAHGFSTVVSKPSPKPLAKSAKVADETVTVDKAPEETVKPVQKGAKAAKGGAE